MSGELIEVLAQLKLWVRSRCSVARHALSVNGLAAAQRRLTPRITITLSIPRPTLGRGSPFAIVIILESLLDVSCRGLYGASISARLCRV